MFDYGYGFGFDMCSIMFTTVFVIVIGTFIVTAIRGIGQWSKNNNSPRLTVPATVVTKRTNVTPKAIPPNLILPRRTPKEIASA